MKEFSSGSPAESSFLEQHVLMAEKTLGKVEDQERIVGTIEERARLLGDYFYLVKREDLRQEAARMATRGVIEEILSRNNDTEYMPEALIHTLPFSITGETRVKIHDAVYIKVTDFMGYVYETVGDFKGALRSYARAHPEKYKEMDENEEIEKSALKEKFNFSEIQDREIANRLVYEKFEGLIQWLSTETDFMKNKPEEIFSRLLEQARTIMQSIKK
jgi:hypothetical protein